MDRPDSVFDWWLQAEDALMVESPSTISDEEAGEVEVMAEEEVGTMSGSQDSDNNWAWVSPSLLLVCSLEVCSRGDADG